MANIFKNADFGKPYRTRDGELARYCGYKEEISQHILLVGDDKINTLIEYFFDGKRFVNGDSGYDIVSEWEEDIDKDKVYNCAKDAFKHSAFKSDDAWGEAVYCTGYYEGWCDAIKTIQDGDDE